MLWADGKWLQQKENEDRLTTLLIDVKIAMCFIYMLLFM